MRTTGNNRAVGVQRPDWCSSLQHWACFSILEGTGDACPPQPLQIATMPLVPATRSLVKHFCTLDSFLPIGWRTWNTVYFLRWVAQLHPSLAPGTGMWFFLPSPTWDHHGTPSSPGGRQYRGDEYVQRREERWKVREKHVQGEGERVRVEVKGMRNGGAVQVPWEGQVKVSDDGR